MIATPLPAYRFKSIQSLFVAGILLLIAIVSLPLLFSGAIIINDLTAKFGNEILREELGLLIKPITLRYKTLGLIGLEDTPSLRKEIKITSLQELGSYRYRDSGRVFVVTTKGEKLLLTDDFTGKNDRYFNLFRAKIEQTQTMLEYQTGTNERIGVSRYYPPWNAYIGLSMDRQELFDPHTLFIQISMLILLLLLFIASLCALPIHHFIIAPILRLTRYAEQVSNGNLEAEIPGTFILELATVKKDIMRMVSSLRSREQKYREIFNAPSDAIVLHDAKSGAFIEVNAAVRTMYGYSPDEFLTLNVGDISSGNAPYTWTEAKKRLARLSLVEHLRFEWHAKKKDGTCFWVDVSLRRFCHEDNKYVLAVIRDIDVQKQTAENLAAEKERLGITLRSIGDGVITIDNQGLVVLVNKVAEKLTGWSQNEAAGLALDQVLRLENNKNGTPPPRPTFLNDATHLEHGAESTLIARNGSTKEISSNAAPIFDTASQVVGIVLVLRDITDKREREREIMKIKKLESVGVLAGGIAHDFNNILSAILGNINLARLDLQADSQPAILLQEAEKAAVRASHLTQQLLTFSKGGEPLLETTNLAGIINDNAKFVLRGSSIHYNLKVPSDLWQVDIDPGQIGQVIQNIIINSRQAMEGGKGGHIAISANNCTSCSKGQFSSPQCVHIDISDDGPGISSEILEKIFDPYFSTKQRGSGLGLAICHSIILKHGGLIDVQSAPGQGTQFTLKLPVTQTVSLPAPLPRDTPTLSRVPLKVLVMDDEEMLLQIAVKMLQVLGHQAETASNGETALNQYHEALRQGVPFDAVIMDLTIPGGLGGKEAGAQLLARHPQAKIIVASGYSNDPVMANYQEYGFVAMLIKPFLMDDLAKALAGLSQDTDHRQAAPSFSQDLHHGT